MTRRCIDRNEEPSGALPEPTAAPRRSGGRGQLHRDGRRHCVGRGKLLLLLLLLGGVAHGLEKVVRAGGGLLLEEGRRCTTGRLLLLLFCLRLRGCHTRRSDCHGGAAAVHWGR